MTKRKSLCEYAKNCRQYQSASRQNSKDADAQLEVCTGTTQFYQTCYHNKKDLETSKLINQMAG